MAVIVNGEGISLQEFQAEVQRYLQIQAENGQPVDEVQAASIVLNDLVEQLLLAQGAASEGYVVDDAALQARLDALGAQIGGAQALAAWQAAHGYTDAEFRSALRRQIAAAWMRDRIRASVPTVAEQVHVRQMRFATQAQAQQALQKLESGWAFDLLARQIDPLAGGELGWFPRGYLFYPELEAAAFALQPGQYSGIIQTPIGYHILYLVERDPARPLTEEALLALQEKALQEWLTQRLNASTIIVSP
ncbi:MAG: peptidylprolyl isomerase [Anaerolineales bacterium]|nr:peptidylprolyl isomerase [Anaerolineales bacterium]